MDFKNYLKTQYRYKQETTNQKERYIKQWKALVSTKEHFNKSTTKQLLKYIETQKKHYTNQALNARIQALEQYFYYLIKTKKRKEHPLKNFRVKTTKPKLLKGFLNNQELDSIYTNYPKKGHHKGQFNLYAQRNKVLLGLLIYQAIPTRELEKLSIKSIDLEEVTITINKRKLSLKALQILELQEYITTTRPKIKTLLNLENSTLLFPKSNKTKLSLTLVTIKKQIKNYFEIESIKQLKDSRIRLWLKKYNPREVQYKTGYKSLLSLEKYNQNKLDSLKQAVEKYHPF